MTENSFNIFFFLELAGELTIIILRSETDTRLKKNMYAHKWEEPEVNTVSILC
jgi:hypothetical protein